MYTLQRLKLLLSTTQEELDRASISNSLCIAEYIEAQMDLDMENSSSETLHHLLHVSSDKARLIKLSNVSLRIKSMFLDLLLDIGLIITTNGAAMVLSILKFIKQLAGAISITIDEKDAHVVFLIVCCIKQKRKVTLPAINKLAAKDSPISQKDIKTCLGHLSELGIIKKSKNEWLLCEHVIIDVS